VRYSAVRACLPWEMGRLYTRLTLVRPADLPAGAGAGGAGALRDALLAAAHRVPHEAGAVGQSWTWLHDDLADNDGTAVRPGGDDRAAVAAGIVPSGTLDRVEAAGGGGGGGGGAVSLSRPVPGRVRLEVVWEWDAAAVASVAGMALGAVGAGPEVHAHLVHAGRLVALADSADAVMRANAVT
jgi:hypothetical protein